MVRDKRTLQDIYGFSDVLNLIRSLAILNVSLKSHVGFFLQNTKLRPYNELLCRRCFIGSCKGGFKRYIQYAPVTLALLNSHGLHGCTVSIGGRLRKWANFFVGQFSRENGGAAYKGIGFVKNNYL